MRNYCGVELLNDEKQVFLFSVKKIVDRNHRFFYRLLLNNNEEEDCLVDEGFKTE
jgi:hypothetical protein